MTPKTLKWLHLDKSANAIVGRARKRDARYGSGDTHDFALFVVDETRKAVARETSELREAVRVLRQPLLIAASYDRAPPTIGVRFWLDDVRKALAATAHLAPGGDE